MGKILQTPEQYLGAHGFNFNLPPVPDDVPVSKAPPPLSPAKILLSVDPVFSEEARRERYSGTVALAVIVGTDGRVHRPKVAHSIGHGLDENALRVISMWRFEPLRQLDKPVAATATITVKFSLY